MSGSQINEPFSHVFTSGTAFTKEPLSIEEDTKKVWRKDLEWENKKKYSNALTLFLENGCHKSTIRLKGLIRNNDSKKITSPCAEASGFIPRI